MAGLDLTQGEEEFLLVEGHAQWEQQLVQWDCNQNSNSFTIFFYKTLKKINDHIVDVVCFKFQQMKYIMCHKSCKK